MSASERTVYGRTFAVTPRWLWIMQRLTALALGPLVALHVAIPQLAGNQYVLLLLLLSIAAHGYSGLRRYGAPVQRATAYTLLAVAWTAAVLVLGVLIIVAR
ncbi:MAG TPA: hypothetical protein VFC39_20245 [Acidobacteriaceae bacterium]|nr:hypothetical protein [Acidobacteriaceae bacterium]